MVKKVRRKSKRLSGFIESAETSPAYYADAAWLQFSEDILRLMDQQTVSRADFARRADVSRAYISKVFTGTENLSLLSMAKLALALGASPRIHVAPLHVVTRWYDVMAVNHAISPITVADDVNDAIVNASLSAMDTRQNFQNTAMATHWESNG